MKDFLLELYSEELPFDAQLAAEENYLKIFKIGFEANFISCNSIKVFTTPCRIVVIASGLPEFIEYRAEKIKGPKISLGVFALEGFLKKNNIDRGKVYEEKFADQAYWMFDKPAQSKNTAQVLEELIPNLINEHKWKKSVNINGIFWPRPLKNILCLFGNSTIEFRYVTLTTNNITFGNKFLSEKEKINIINIKDYYKVLGHNYVLLSSDDRKKQVIQQANKLINDINSFLRKEKLLAEFDLNVYENLLNKVASYFEYPVLFLGEINKKYLNSLPALLIQEVLEKHQRYFALYFTNAESQLVSNELSSYFLFVANNLTADKELIRKSHENTANARLEDALFLLAQDQKTSLELLCEKLKNIIFHEKLGSIHDKCQRLSKWHIKALYNEKGQHSNFLMIKADLLDKININFPNIAKYSKCDLATCVINEFPELRGKILNHLTSIKEQSFYNPEFEKFIEYQYSIECAKEENSAYLLFALADNLDSLTGLYLAGERMTSGGDRYNMRKYALNILSIIRNLSQDDKLQLQINNLQNYEKGNISINDLVKVSADLFADKFNINNVIIDDIVEFIRKRHLEYLQTKYNVCLVNAAINSGICLTRGYLPSSIETLLAVLADVINNKHPNILLTDFIGIINVAKRINNILDENKVNEVIKSIVGKESEQSLNFYKARYFNHLNICNIDSMSNVENSLLLKNLWNKTANYYNESFPRQNEDYSVSTETKRFAEQSLNHINYLVKDINKFLDIEHIYNNEGEINSISCYELLIAGRALINYLVDFKHLYSLVPHH